MNKERINDLLLRAKEVYKNGGDREDIYDLLLNTTYKMVPFSKYVSVHKEKVQEEIAKKLNISLEEFMTRRQ